MSVETRIANSGTVGSSPIVGLRIGLFELLVRCALADRASVNIFEC